MLGLMNLTFNFLINLLRDELVIQLVLDKFS